jgi:hypothetical protein
MNPNIAELLNSIHEPTEISDDENEYRFRRSIAQNYLSYEEKIYTGERSKQDSLKKIHDYAKIWGVRNALNTLLEWTLPDPAQGDFGAIVDPDEEPDMVTGENRDRVLDMFNERFDYDEFDEDIPKMKLMFNVLVDEMLAKELTEHDLEMVAMDIWYTIHDDIG